MKNYQILEDADKFFVLQAPNGAKVKIAKSGLGKDTLQKIQGMAQGGKVEYGASQENTLNESATDTFKKAFKGEKEKPKPEPEPKKIAQYADGGVVDEQDTQTQKPVEININTSQPQSPESQDKPPGWFSNVVNSISQSPIAKTLLTGDTSHLSPQAPQAVPAVAQAQPAIEQTQPNPRNALAEVPQGQAVQNPIQQIISAGQQPSPGEAQAMGQYLQAGQKGISELDKENNQIDKSFEQGYGQSSDFVQKIDAHEQRAAKINKSLEDLGKNIQEFKFEPKTMFSGGNFFSNIGTALSVLAGGLSQGLTGAKTNPVMDYINRQIDLDIDRQKHEYGKLQNQYTILRQQGLNEMEAVNLLRAQQHQTVASMLQMSQLKSRNTQVKLGLQQAQAGMALQAQMAAKQAATEQTLRANLEGQIQAPIQGGVTQVSDTQAQSQKQTLSPDVHSKFEQIAQSLPGLVKNEKFLPKAIEEVQRIGSIHEQSKDILEKFEKSVKAQSLGNRLSRVPWREPAEISSLRQLLIPLIKVKEGTPREFEAHTLDKLLPALGDTSNDTKEKRDGLQKFLMEGSVSSLLDTLRVPYPKLMLGGRQPK